MRLRQRIAARRAHLGGLTDDQLASRGALGERSKAAVDGGKVRLMAPFRVSAFALEQGAKADTRNGAMSRTLPPSTAALDRSPSAPRLAS